jgi:hypothetical protein
LFAFQSRILFSKELGHFYGLLVLLQGRFGTTLQGWTAEIILREALNF